MSDNPGWLKSLRARTTGASSPSISGRGHFLDESHSRPNEMPHINHKEERSRIASFLNINSAKPSSSNMDSATNDQYLPKDPYEIWHEPDIEQLVDTLQVVMMMRSTFEAVPIQYNSTILQILESYGKFRADNIKLKRKYEEALVDFKENEAIWEAKQAEYEGELKRLEIIIAKGVTGLDQVTIARSSSKLERSSPVKKKSEKSELFPQLERLFTIKGKQSADKDAQLSQELMAAERRVAGSQRLKTERPPQAHSRGDLAKTEPGNPPAQSVQQSQTPSEPSALAYSLGTNRDVESSDNSSTSSSDDDQDSAQSFAKFLSRGSQSHCPSPVDSVDANKESLGLPAASNTRSFSSQMRISSQQRSSMGQISTSVARDLGANHDRGFSFLPGNDTLELHKATLARGESNQYEDDEKTMFSNSRRALGEGQQHMRASLFPGSKQFSRQSKQTNLMEEESRSHPFPDIPVPERNPRSWAQNASSIGLDLDQTNADAAAPTLQTELPTSDVPSRQRSAGSAITVIQDADSDTVAGLPTTKS